MVKDDEEYKNAREDQKNDWWLIPLGGDKPGIKIPIPFEVGTLYKVLPEQIMRMLSEEEHDIRDVRGEMARQLKSSLLLDLRPQFIRPMIDAWTNKDAYQRDAIVPQWMGRHCHGKRAVQSIYQLNNQTAWGEVEQCTAR